MKVVLDTCAIRAESKNLTSPNINLLITHARSLNIIIGVPQVVLDELVGAYRRELLDLKEKIEQATEKMNDKISLFDGHLDSSVTEELVESCVRRYGRHLVEKLCPEEYQQLPYPSVSHSTIIDRASKRRRPFNEKKTGYGDTLIWLSVLESLLNDETPICFVTENKADFCKSNSETELHPHLIADLEMSKIPSNRVRVVPSISVVVSQHVTPYITPIQAIVDEIYQGQFDLAPIESWTEAAIDAYLAQQTRNPPFYKFQFTDDVVWIDDYTLESIGPFEEFQAFYLTQEFFVLKFRTIAECTFYVETDSGSTFDWEPHPDDPGRMKISGHVHRSVSLEISLDMTRDPPYEVLSSDARIPPEEEIVEYVEITGSQGRHIHIWKDRPRGTNRSHRGFGTDGFQGTPGPMQ